MSQGVNSRQRHLQRARRLWWTPPFLSMPSQHTGSACYPLPMGFSRSIEKARLFTRQTEDPRQECRHSCILSLPSFCCKEYGSAFAPFPLYIPESSQPWKDKLPHRHRESSAERKVYEEWHTIPVFHGRVSQLHRVLSTYNVLTNVLVSSLCCLFLLILSMKTKCSQTKAHIEVFWGSSALLN